MICILHGYLLEGSGSNLWTRSIIQSLCRLGETVHLVCQENHPDLYDFIAEAHRYLPDGSVETFLDRDVPYPGRCILHKPQLGDTLPVYVRDEYEEFSNVVPMVELPDEAIEDYLHRNVTVVERVVREHGITAMHINHAVLMSVVGQRVRERTDVPYAIMPHGSAIEYAVKRDERMLRYALAAFTGAGRIFVIGPEMRSRVRSIFGMVPGLEEKMTELRLGVDTDLFELVPQEQRPENIAKLTASLAGVKRGKPPEQALALRERLRSGGGAAGLDGALEAGRGYDSKSPDMDVEAKLQEVDWASDEILLFVGRLIAGKGIQAIVGALPLIFERCSTARLVVVGHGPLREVLEALLWALEHEDRALARKIIAHGRALEGSTEGEEVSEELTSVAHFLRQLEQRGELDAYFEQARRHIRPDRVIFTGYLTHRELRYLFPCCDVAIFPSVVREAGPLVFLEALAAGCFPLGTYFGGMAASIDSIAEAVPREAAELMKLSPEAEQTVADIAAQAPQAVGLQGRYREALRDVAVEKYDWRNVTRHLVTELRSLGEEEGRPGTP